MDKNKTELEEFMGSLGGSGNKDPLQDKEEDPFGHFEEKEPEIEEIKDEKPLPFNKDPKIQKYLEKREREIEDRLTERFGNKQPVREEKPADDRVNDVLVRLIGNDTPEKLSMVKEFKDILGNLKGEARAEALDEIRNMQSAEVEADREAEQQLETAFENIEETFSVDITSNNPIARKTRQEFVSFVEKIAPKDQYGDIVDYPDMVQAFETFSVMKKSTATPSRAKELASRSMQRSSEANSEPNIPRSRTPFASSDAFIESLSK